MARNEKIGQFHVASSSAPKMRIAAAVDDDTNLNCLAGYEYVEVRVAAAAEAPTCCAHAAASPCGCVVAAVANNDRDTL
jgi:hypothetical protein